MNSHKIIPYEQASKVFAKLKSEGKRIVRCHGTFDLIHPGHIHHLCGVDLQEFSLDTVACSEAMQYRPVSPSTPKIR
jgi:hypothetical protein